MPALQVLKYGCWAEPDLMSCRTRVIEEQGTAERQEVRVGGIRSGRALCARIR